MKYSVPVLPSLFSWRGQGRLFFYSIIKKFTLLRLCLGQSSSTIHTLFFFFLQMRSDSQFSPQYNQNRSCFSPYSCFSSKDIQTVFSSTCSKYLASPQATESHFRFPSKNVLKVVVFSRTYSKAPLFYP